MNKNEIHYLNCTDSDCEFFACVARRDYERQISLHTEALEAAYKQGALARIERPSEIEIALEIDKILRCDYVDALSCKMIAEWTIENIKITPLTAEDVTKKDDNFVTSKTYDEKTTKNQHIKAEELLPSKDEIDEKLKHRWVGRWSTELQEYLRDFVAAKLEQGK